MAKTRMPNSPVQERDPERENAVRVAALVAAGGKSVPESVLNDIVVKATRPGMSIAQSVNEAASAIQQIVNATPAVNFSAAPQSSQPGHHHHYASGTAGQRQSALAMDDDGDRGARTSGADNSSLRFGELSMTPAMRDAHALAVRTPGMGWAADNHALLRIPGAIQTFIDAKIREESYKAVKGVGFTDHDAVAAAKWSTVNGKNGSDVFNNMADSVRLFGGNDPEAKKRWRDLFNNLHKKSDDEKAKQEMRDALKGEEAHPDAKRRDQARKVRDIYKLEEGAKKDADVKADKANAKENKAEAKEHKAEVVEKKEEIKASAVLNLADEWNTPASPAAPQTPKPGNAPTPHTQPAIVTKQAEATKSTEQSKQPNQQIAQAAAPKPAS